MNNPSRLALILLIPPILGGLVAAWPAAPASKMAFLAVAAGIVSVIFFGVCLFDVFRPSPTRLRIPLVWLAAGAGLGCVSAMLSLMAHTWGLPLQRMPLGKAGFLLLTAAAMFGLAMLGMFHAMFKPDPVKGEG